MKQNQKGRRGRHRNQNRRSGGDGSRDGRNQPTRNRNQARQQAEKYTSLAREAQQAQDIVEAENCFQHAEYYLRLLSELEGGKPQPEPAKAPQSGGEGQNGVEAPKDEPASKVIPLEAGDESAKDSDDEALSA